MSFREIKSSNLYTSYVDRPKDKIVTENYFSYF